MSNFSCGSGVETVSSFGAIKKVKNETKTRHCNSNNYNNYIVAHYYRQNSNMTLYITLPLVVDRKEFGKNMLH